MDPNVPLALTDGAGSLPPEQRTLTPEQAAELAGFQMVPALPTYGDTEPGKPGTAGSKRSRRSGGTGRSGGSGPTPADSVGTLGSISSGVSSVIANPVVRERNRRELAKEVYRQEVLANDRKARELNLLPDQIEPVGEFTVFIFLPEPMFDDYVLAKDFIPKVHELMPRQRKIEQTKNSFLVHSSANVVFGGRKPPGVYVRLLAGADGDNPLFTGGSGGGGDGGGEG